MLTIEQSVVIGRLIEQVFAFVANFATEPQYNRALRSVHKTSPGEQGGGAAWHEVVKVAG